MVSDITNKLLLEIELWQQRLLSSVYPYVAEKNKKQFTADLKTIYFMPHLKF